MSDETTTSDDEPTPAQTRLKIILELKEEGFSNVGIADFLGLDEASVRGILSNHLREIDDQPPVLRSSLAEAMTNHTPAPHLIKHIERIRKAADDLCLVIDEVTPSSREASLAKTHLEETVMWAVKSIVLPRH